MRHASLFSGIGGFDLAAQWMGWTNVFSCEIEEFPRTILKHHFPEAIHYEDIKRTDFTVHRGQIDILTGGFPCQPFSTAGKRLGKNDERHLWPEMYRAIREIQPRWVVGENVRGLLSWSDGLVLDEVYADLEGEGYEVQAFVLPAAGVNAPHRRDRVWIVAHSESNGSRGASDEASRKIEGQDGIENTKSFKRSSLQFTPNASGIGCGRWDQRSEADQRAQWTLDQDERHYPDGVRCKAEGCCADAPNTKSQRHESLNRSEPSVIQSQTEKTLHGRGGDQSRSWDATNANSAGVQGLTADARPGEGVGQGRKGFEEAWNLGYAADWRSFPTQPPVCGGDDGIPTALDGITISRWRRESIKAYGNAIVPQIAYRIFQAIQTSTINGNPI